MRLFAEAQARKAAQQAEIERLAQEMEDAMKEEARASAEAIAAQLAKEQADKEAEAARYRKITEDNQKRFFEVREHQEVLEQAPEKVDFSQRMHLEYKGILEAKQAARDSESKRLVQVEALP